MKNQVRIILLVYVLVNIIILVSAATDRTIEVTPVKKNPKPRRTTISPQIRKTTLSGRSGS
jgi:hypothetical protein